MEIRAINQKFNKAIQLTEEATAANIGTFLLTADAVFIKSDKSNIPLLSDWTMLQQVDLSPNFIQDEYTNTVPLRGGINVSAADGVDVVISENTIEILGNFHYGIGAPSNIKELLEYELGLYLDTNENAVYIWNPIKKIWAEPFRLFAVTFNSQKQIGYDSIANVLNLPQSLSVPTILVTKKIGLTAILSAKDTVTAASDSQFKWRQTGGSVKLVFAQEDSMSTTVFAASPGTAQIELTVINSYGAISYKTIILNFSFYIQVLGNSDSNFSFQTLGDAFEWIRMNDNTNVKKYFIDVFGSTEEKFDVLVPTESTVNFKNGGISCGILFNKGTYNWNGVNQAHVVLNNSTKGIILASDANVTFTNLHIINTNIITTVTAQNAIFNLINSSIISNVDAIISTECTINIIDSTITTIQGLSLHASDSNIILKNSTVSTTNGKQNISIVNSMIGILACNISQNNIDGDFNIYINNTNQAVSISHSTIFSLIKSDEKKFAGDVFIKNDGETILRYNMLISKQSVAFIAMCKNLRASNNYLDGCYSFIANRQDQYMEPDFDTVYSGVHLNELIGKFILKNLDATNYYEL